MMRKLCEKISEYYAKIGRRRIIVSEEYMLRHYLLFMGQEHDNPLNKNHKEHRFNAFLHNIRGSDEPIYHDHPWSYVTIILCGGYWEHTPIFAEDGTYLGDKRVWYGPGSIIRGRPDKYHWLEMGPESTWTLFLRGKRVNIWGFLPSKAGQIPSKIDWREWHNKKEALGFSRGGN